MTVSDIVVIVVLIILVVLVSILLIQRPRGNVTGGADNSFPYLYLTLPDPDKMFKSVKNAKFIVKDKKSRSPILIRTFPEDYKLADAISNHFIEDVRIDCRAGMKPTPRETWESMHDVSSTDSVADLREKIYESTRECNTFNPVFVKWMINYLFPGRKNIKMLDPSSGWGDRLIGAAAAGIDTYIGFDPNPRLKLCYKQMIKQFTKPNQNFVVNSEPFSQPNTKFDLTLTSPPYFNYEEYVLPGMEGEDKQSIGMYPEYEDWKEKMYKPYITDMYNSVKSGGWVVIYIEDYFMDGKLYPLRKLTQSILESLGAKKDKKIHQFGLQIKVANQKPRTRWAMVYRHK